MRACIRLYSSSPEPNFDFSVPYVHPSTLHGHKYGLVLSSSLCCCCCCSSSVSSSSSLFFFFHFFIYLYSSINGIQLHNTSSSSATTSNCSHSRPFPRVSCNCEQEGYLLICSWLNNHNIESYHVN